MILKDAFIYTYSDGAQAAYGNIFNDEHERFSDGTCIRTTLIREIYKDPETGKRFIQTKNNKYEIEYAEGAEIPEAHA